MSEMQSWAEREIEFACKRERVGNDNPDGTEWDYGCACYESALKAFKSLMGDGHSGFSISATKHILNRLIDGKPLTPIEDTPDIWNDISDISGLEGEYQCKRMGSLFKYVHADGTIDIWNDISDINSLKGEYQCKRMSSLFKYVYADGTIKYKDVNSATKIDIDSKISYHSGLVDRVINEMFPITMPYTPTDPIRVYCKDLLTDRKNGDFDTVAIFYAIKPGGERIEINRFFKESKDDWVEIDHDEYELRQEIENRRLAVEEINKYSIEE